MALWAVDTKAPQTHMHTHAPVSVLLCVVCLVLHRAAEVWLPDTAWAAGVKGFSRNTAAAAAADIDSNSNTSSTQAGCSSTHSSEKGADITWRRLHAMGPSALLEQQMQLGLLASLSTTQ